MIPRPWDNIVTGCAAMSPTMWSTISLCCCSWKRSTSEFFFPLSPFPQVKVTTTTTTTTITTTYPWTTCTPGHDTFFPGKLQTRNEHDIKRFFNELPCQPRPRSFSFPSDQRETRRPIFAYNGNPFLNPRVSLWILFFFITFKARLPGFGQEDLTQGRIILFRKQRILLFPRPWESTARFFREDFHRVLEFLFSVLEADDRLVRSIDRPRITN